MTRLFISLYLLIIAGLLSIGWLGEQVWQAYQPKQDNRLALIKGYTALLPDLLQHAIVQGNDEALTDKLVEIETKLQIQLQVIANDKIQLNFPDHQEAIISYTDDNQMMIYQSWPAHNSLIQLGPIQLEQDKSHLKSAFQVFSYLLLALFIAAWTWPLWRDLRKLQSSAQYFSQGEFDYKNDIHQQSVIKPISNSFEAMAAQIKSLLAEQKLLVNSVSHDLRTPISRLKFGLALLPESSQAALPEIKQDISDLENLIDELLSYARLEQDSKQLNLEMVNVSELLLNQVEKLTKTTALKLNTEQVKESNWLCDGHLIERVIQNLLTNAIRFAREQVQLSVSSNKAYLVIVIEDDGIGIESHDYQTVFKAFSRLDNNHKKSSGFGLGLAIVEKICVWHQGYCELAKSDLGGAKFSVYIPKQSIN